MYKNIEDYGIIGDMHAVALVSKDGSIDYACLPHIDSPTVFASILDDKKGGFFNVSPTQKFESEQSYIQDTNILKTTFVTPSGSAELIDFMSVSLKRSDLFEKESHDICRVVKGIKGETEFQAVCYARPEYAVSTPKIEQNFIIRGEKEVFTLIVKGENLKGEIQQDKIVFKFKVPQGKAAMFMFTYGENPNKEIDTSLLDETKEYWQKWLQSCESGRCRLFGEYQEMINRSLLVLKLLTFAPSGAIAAAATTSLPEAIGGERNWDYRFTWLRDSSFTLKALFSVGHISETDYYVHWLQAIFRKYGKKNLQIMYGLDGRWKLDEKELKHLDGYMGSKPVRIGNAAYAQKQLDIYGEIMDSALRLSDYVGHIDEELWPFFRRVCNMAVSEWQNPDAGIWEMRGKPYHFVYSKLMCWVALDRGIKIVNRYGFEAEIDIWKETADKIKDEIISKGFNKRLNSFIQHYDTDALDASLLLMPLMGFLPIQDEKIQGTIAAVQKHLNREGYLLRYNAEDGLSGEEGAFVFCNFWLIECLILSGKIEEAKELMKKTLEAANHLGLFSEEYAFKNKKMLGNFPQAFTHIGFINAVNALLAAQRPKFDQEIKDSFIKKIIKLLPRKLLLNSSKEKTKEATQTIAADLKKTLNHLQGAFFDVESGKVNYEEMKKSGAYRKYVELSKKLSAFDLNTLKTDQKKKAFWINIYNILIIHGVIELEIQNSVKEVFNFFKRISYNIGGRNFTPDDIEHGILRKLDPRVHFALVCASSSCPPIEFYDSEKIDKQLDLAARSFLNRRGAVLDRDKKTLFLSQIFMWFRNDFGKTDREAVKFILPYLREEDKNYIEKNLDSLRIDYLSYDWNLNRSLK
jgi:GH15 family glucan-1,4-alpha-glucosidase